MAMTDKDRDRFVALAFCRADLLFELDDALRVVFAAGASKPLLGKGAKELHQSPFLDLIADRDRPLAEQMFQAASSKGRMDDIMVKLKSAGGGTANVAISGYRVPDFDNDFFVAIKVEPVREAEIPDEDLVRDEESGLLDQGSFAQVAAQKTLAFQRAGGQAQVTMVKVDNLEKLIKKLGASDKKKLLGAIGDILKDASLGKDMASTLGGDAFSYVHGSDVDTEAVNREIEKAAQGAHPEGETVTSRSNTLDADGAGMTENQVAKALIHTMQRFCADEADLREASLSDSLHSMMTNTVENIAFLKDATRTRAFDLVFMPICALRTERIHHFEGLTRFRDQQRGKSPYHLINLAEEIGIVHDFDIAVCEKTVSLVRRFTKKEAIPPVAINVSGKSIENDRFVQDLHELLGRSGDVADLMLFEITESARIENLEKVNKIVQSFRDAGFKICLDDFGAGSASFDYLNALDVDIVKFDGPVVKRACTTPKGNDLVAALAKMCHNMNIETVAEMVEDKKMANHVFYLGIDFGQGWHFGKPAHDPMKFSDKFVQRVINA